MSYIYVIASDAAVKIGISDDPEKRLIALQTSHHSKLQLIAKFHCQDRQLAAKLEKRLHKLFKSYRMNGEWFRVNPHIVKETLSDYERSGLLDNNPRGEIGKYSFNEIIVAMLSIYLIAYLTMNLAFATYLMLRWLIS